ncbi:hypothetical protein BKP35_16830 [Anaerobacillus arseniciselenatis]|uniref:ADP-ribosylglycohydrolase n=1 Tax=Anaerobacillus arseniciselenatis TaxID=85682 RepID=A0A1S2LCS7_9BACI|nr:ADP-ribosylglycohydrolase family protein [Anaerobacillus arseniciselenatis]OIJ09335.1 hypothetical protein BKP35_16830 [Anaerobacillus arseniciselenatis]
MMGAIIGDIVGSRFEFNNHKSKEFELFTKECHVTDDSIMTLAIAKAILETEKMIKPLFNGADFENDYCLILEGMTIKYMQEIGRKYPNCGYGNMFSKWVFSENPEPYNSYGNGAAMRISPVGFIARSEGQATRLSEIVTGVTHNHVEGFKGAEATAVAIFMARRGFTKEEIRNKINENYYSLDFTIDNIRDSYQFNATCQETVPQAIVSFLEATSFEDAIRTAISIGGDSDTLTAITGSIAEAYYGVPEKIKEKALTYLSNDLRTIFDEWFRINGAVNIHGKFKVLTKYIGKIAATESFGERFIDYENDGTIGHPIQIPFVNFDELVNIFVEEFYNFSDNHPEYKLVTYVSILEDNRLQWDDMVMRSAEVESLDAQCILAMIMGAIRAERFCDGALLSFFKDGFISKWLKRLKAIDGSNVNKPIEEIYFEIGSFGDYDTYHIIFEEGSSSVFKTTLSNELPVEEHYLLEKTTRLLNDFNALQVEYWDSEYIDPCVCDGTQWELGVKYKGERGTVWEGSNAYPPNWDDLLVFFGIEPDDEDEEE